MQAALDSTALMLSKTAMGKTEAQIQTTASDYFKALFNRPEASDLVVTATYTTVGGSQIALNATTNVKTDFMGLMGVTQMKIGVGTVVKWGNTRLRVALALDTTGSMDDDGKIEALRSATKSLLAQLKAIASKDGDVYVSIIPFSKDVRLRQDGLHRELDSLGSLGRKERRLQRQRLHVQDVLPEPRKNLDRRQSQLLERLHHRPRSGFRYDERRAQRQQQRDVVPGGTIRFLPGATPRPHLRLDGPQREGRRSLPSGNTNQGIGIAWAFQSLTASPFTIPAKDPDFKYNEVIILMSDGLNTQNRFSSSQSAIDARELTTCTNAKNAGIVIYTVQVNTGGDPTQNVMKNCATTTDKFTEIKQANQMVSAFNSIGTALTNLRIAQ